MQKLHTVQNTILRHIVIAKNVVLSDVVHKDLNIRPLSQVIKNLAQNVHSDRVLIRHKVLNNRVLTMLFAKKIAGRR